MATMSRLRRILAVVVIGVSTGAATGAVFAPGASPSTPGISWSSKFIPINLSSLGTNVSVTAESCPDVSDCVAVGDAQNSNGNAQPIAITLSSGGWNAGVLPAPTTPSGLPPPVGYWSTLTLTGISCVAVGSCLAVGNATPVVQPAGGPDQFGFAEVLTGQKWTGTTLIAPQGTNVVSMTGVSCVNATTCFAVGSADIGKKPSAIAYALFGAAPWTGPLSLPNPAPTFRFVSLSSVSCTSTTACVAAGTYFGTLSEQHPYVEQLQGSTWSTVALPLPTGAVSGALSGVSCAGSTCQAVGSMTVTGSSELQPLVASNGGANHWTVAELSPPAPSSVSASLAGVSCATAVACTAVGSFLDTTNATHALVEGLNSDGSWSPTVGLDLAGTTSATLDAVSCPSLCVAVGNGSVTAGGLAPIAAIENGPETLLQVQAPGTATLGTPENFKVTAVNPGGGVDTSYAGTVDFRSTDPFASLPAASTLTNGVGTFAFTFQTIGPQTISVFDSVDTFIGGTSGTIVVSGRNVRPPPPPPPPPHGAPTASGGRLFAGLPNGTGYWLANAAGGVFTYGKAQFYGSLGGVPLNQSVVGMASTPDGAGYWLVASDGGIFSFGDAQFFGSTGAIHLNQPVVDMASTPDGGGYWLVASDGGIFSFGDAQFFGSTGAIPLNEPVDGMATTPDGGGYWLVASDGGIFAFGDAPFLGSLGALGIANPIVGMASTRDGEGYWMVGTDGGVYAEGDAAFEGSLGNKVILWPILGIMANTGGGYSLVDMSGAATQFG